MKKEKNFKINYRNFILIVLVILLINLIIFASFKFNFIRLSSNISEADVKNLNNLNSIYDLNTWAEFSRNNEIKNENAIEVHIKNQKDLNDYLARTGKDLSGDMIWLENVEDIIFPTGTYTFVSRTEFYLPTAVGNIDFHGSTFAIGSNGGIWMTMIENQNNRSFENLIVYGSTSIELGDTGSGYYHSNKNITRIGTNDSFETQGFYLQAMKASNMNFKNLEFNNSQIENLHLFDIMGCENINFDNITNRGYLENFNQDQLRESYSVSKHTLASELIQIDIAVSSGQAQHSFLSQEFKNKYFSTNSYYDETATKKVNINNVRSVGYAGITGQSIIDGTSNSIYKPYSSTIGSHTVNDDPYKEITVKNNYFENVVHIDEVWDRYITPIHFLIVSRETQQSLSGLSYPERITLISSDSVWNNSDITISDNEYINCYTEYYDPLSVNKKFENSVYQSGFDTVERNINQIKLIDDNEEIIKEYDSYYPEESFFNNYIFVSSKYDYDTKELYRKYRKTNIYEINVDINIDNEGSKIENTENYDLLKTSVDSESKEKLINGDIIIVRYTKNIYEPKKKSIFEVEKEKIVKSGDYILSELTLLFLIFLFVIKLKYKISKEIK